MPPAYLLGPQVALHRRDICWGKTGYSDRFVAERIATHHNRRRRRAKRWSRAATERLVAYKCRLCRCWHIGRSW